MSVTKAEKCLHLIVTVSVDYIIMSISVVNKLSKKKKHKNGNPFKLKQKFNYFNPKKKINENLLFCFENNKDNWWKL